MKIFGLLIFAIIFSAAASAADVSNGSDLHAESCVQCHDSAAYTREDRKVSNLPKLGTQVRFCKNNLGVSWFDDEVDDVIGFLNQEYYHF